MGEAPATVVTSTLLPDPDSRRRLGFWSLLVIIFFFVCGGVYGNEALVESGPGLHILLTSSLIPLFYAVPLGLISTELASAIPLDAGPIAWVDQALGAQWGAQNAYWMFVAYIVDCAVYPALAGEYLVENYDLELGDSRRTCVSAIAVGIIGFITCIKLLGTDIFVKFSSALATMCLFPVIVYVLYGFKDASAAPFKDTDSIEVDWPLLLSWSMWLSIGFLNFGSFAGETKDVTSTFPKVMMVVIPVTTLLNVAPLYISLCLDPDPENYEPG